MGTGVTLKSRKKTENKDLERKPLRRGEKVANAKRQNPNYFTMAAEGQPKPQIPKSTKKSSKSHQNEVRMKPMAPKRPAQGPADPP